MPCSGSCTKNKPRVSCLGVLQNRMTHDRDANVPRERGRVEDDPWDRSAQLRALPTTHFMSHGNPFDNLSPTRTKIGPMIAHHPLTSKSECGPNIRQKLVWMDTKLNFTNVRKIKQHTERESPVSCLAKLYLSSGVLLLVLLVLMSLSKLPPCDRCTKCLQRRLHTRSEKISSDHARTLHKGTMETCIYIDTPHKGMMGTYSEHNQNATRRRVGVADKHGRGMCYQHTNTNT